jgi:hypothetical protein
MIEPYGGSAVDDVGDLFLNETVGPLADSETVKANISCDPFDTSQI